MTKLIPIATITLALGLATAAHAQSVTGDWQGTVDAGGGARIRVVFHLTRDDQGRLQATMDVPDQGATDVPVTSATLKGSVLVLDVQVNGGYYEGRVNESADEIDGTWSQAGASLPLKLMRVRPKPGV